MATLASVEDGGAFISTTQLLSVKANLFPSALLASLIDCGIRLHVRLGERLHFRFLCAQG